MDQTSNLGSDESIRQQIEQRISTFSYWVLRRKLKIKNFAHPNCKRVVEHVNYGEKNNTSKTVTIKLESSLFVFLFVYIKLLHCTRRSHN